LEYGTIQQNFDVLSCAFRRDAKGSEPKSLARQSQGNQCPDDSQACQYAMLASVKLCEKNINVRLLVDTEEINSVFYCQLCHGLKAAQKPECISIKTNTSCRPGVLRYLSMALNGMQYWAPPWLAGTRLV